MVLKLGKRGIRSGNTLKTLSVQFLRSYRKDAYIVRKDTNANGDDITSEMFGVEDLHSTGIPYSLNKKGRWLFPTKLMNAIKQGHFHFKDFDVQLFEKHNMTNEKANCVSAHFSKGPIKEATDYNLCGKRKRRKTGYKCGHVQKKKSLHLPQRNNKRLKKGVIPVHQDIRSIDSVENSHITFEVMYPSPPTSSLTHITKHIGYYPNKTKQSSKYHMVRRINQEIVQSDTPNIDQEQEISDCEPRVHDKHQEKKKESIREQSDLLTFITHAIGRKKSTRKRSEELMTDVVPKLEQIVSAEFVPLNENFVRVIIAHTDTHPKTLATLYGSSFIECDCFPRKFIIDISTDLQALEVFKLHWKENIKPIQAFVVFVHDSDNVINTQSDQVYKVYLNSSLTNDMSTSRIETIFDYTETNIAECLNNCLFYIETLPNIVQTQESGVASDKVDMELQVEQFFDMSNTIYLPDDQLLKELNLATGQSADTNSSFVDVSSCHNVADSGLYLSETKDEQCAICYTDIAFDAPGTALRKCGHWFCNQCWEAHLTTQVKGGSIVMECPQFSCKTPVDIGTMMSLLCLRDILQHTRACHDMDVDRHEETKWCPNNKCGRVLQVNSTDAPLINCDCGQRVCFKCLGEVHWPASCQSVMNFRKLFKGTGMTDDEQALIAVKGMNCPHCKRFFEKINGCPYMYCLCTKSFCWGCGRDWYKFSHDNRCNEIGQNIEHMGTTSMLIFSESTRPWNEWISKAVLHREKKDVVKVRTPHLKRFTKELISFMNKSYHTSVICLDFKGSNEGFTAESHKVREFMAHLIDIKFELHFIAENIAILLSSDISLSQRIYFTNLIKKFEYNCTMLEDCFSSTYAETDKHRLIRKMKYFRSNSLQLIKGTAYHVKKLKL